MTSTDKIPHFDSDALTRMHWVSMMPLFLKLQSSVRILIVFWKNLNNIELVRQMKPMNVTVSISVIKMNMRLSMQNLVSLSAQM